MKKVKVKVPNKPRGSWGMVKPYTVTHKNKKCEASKYGCRTAKGGRYD